ncbi:MAG: hypothetical protein M9962_03995 [Oligoflexia bacterium]|nr:hypothetical protein [Oligoflexia bacterium]
MNIALKEAITHMNQVSDEQLRLVSIGEVVLEKDTRNCFLDWIYKNNYIDHSAYSAHLSDKLFFYEFIKTISPDRIDDFLPLTKGVSPYVKNGRIDLDKIENDFGPDFIVKPCSDMDSSGGRLIRGKLELEHDFSIRSHDYMEKKISPLTGIISSGEAYLIQKIVGEPEREYRLHSFFDQTVRGATFTRWDQKWVQDELVAAESFLQKFLDSLPKKALYRQAWSFDVMRAKEGFKIIEVNTNRGKPQSWSGDLSNPDTLAAYVNLFESLYGAKFLGENAEKLRKGEGNLRHFLKKFGKEAVERHFRLREEYKKSKIK